MKRPGETDLTHLGDGLLPQRIRYSVVERELDAKVIHQGFVFLHALWAFALAQLFNDVCR
mgnify:CR=1 FL=1